MTRLPRSAGPSALRSTKSVWRSAFRAEAAGVSGHSSAASLSRGCPWSSVRARYATRACAFFVGTAIGGPEPILASNPPSSDSTNWLIDRRGGPRYGPPDSSSEGGYAPLGLPRPSLGRAPAQPWRASGLTQDVSPAPHPRVDDAVENVGRQVDQHEHRSDDEHRALHHGIVALEHGIERHATDARQREDHFHDDGAAQHVADL